MTKLFSSVTGLAVMALIAMVALWGGQQASQSAQAVAEEPGLSIPLPWPQPQEIPPIPVPPTGQRKVWIPVGDHSNGDHGLDTTAGRMLAQSILTAFAKGPGEDPGKPNIRCVVMKVLVQLVPGGSFSLVTDRWIVWAFTRFTSTGVARGNVLLWNNEGYLGTYPDKSGNTLLRVPDDVTANPKNPPARMVEENCDKFFPPNLPPAAIAQ